VVAATEPIDRRVRLAISQWPDDAPRGAVWTFCAEQGISRKSFYELRKRAKIDGPAAVLEPKTRRPKSSPSKLSDEVKGQAVAVRSALEASGLDHGPISVHEKMHAMGLEQVPGARADVGHAGGVDGRGDVSPLLLNSSSGTAVVSEWSITPNQTKRERG